MNSRARGVEPRPQALVNASETIHKSLGGELGDFRDYSHEFGDGMKVIVADHSPTQSWSHARFQLSIIGADFDVIMRAEDGRSGADDPDRSFTLNDNLSGEQWKPIDEYRDKPRPNWASRFLIELATAKKDTAKQSTHSN